MGSALSDIFSRLASVYQPFVDQYSMSGVFKLSQRNTLIAALVIVGVIVVAFAVTIALLPSKRKVVHKRRVRRTTVALSGTQASSTGGQKATKALSPAARRRRSNVGLAIVTALMLVGVIAAFVATYIYTGTNEYCGRSCHATDPHVVLAVKTSHAKCTDCHEADPISGMASRIRMAIVKTPEVGHSVASVPVDPARCLGCHATVAQTTVVTATGLRISHREIIATGYTCSACHHDIGHAKTGTLTAGMGQCMSCHDGKKAPKTCATCHTAGSPITVASAATKIASQFNYGTVRVANQECFRCHGAEKNCIACHGLVLPHPQAFINGGHARIAAFDGKQMCFKCHSLQWCGNGTCHGAFSMHAASWKTAHQKYTNAQCVGCHLSFIHANLGPNGNFCKVCHP